MSIITARSATAPPLRAAWMLLLVGLLAAALVASLALVGALVLRDNGPDRLNGGLMLPTLALDATWDATSIPGLSLPAGMDVGPDGNLYLVSAGSHEVVVVDPAGTVIRRWGEEGSGEGQFLFHRNPNDPMDMIGSVAVARDGSVYVADMVNDRVQQFTSEGGFVRAWGGHGPGNGQFLEPFDVAVGPDGSVYVVDDLRDDIQRFTAEGVWLQTIGRHGSADGEMDFTGGIDVDPAGTLLNADFGNARIQAWNDDGEYLWSRGGSAEPGMIKGANDIAADTDGAMYVGDEEGIKAFRDAAAPPSMVVPPGWVVGWVAASGDGAVYASSVTTARIHKLRIEYHAASASPSVAPAPSTAAPSAPLASPSPSAATGGPEIVTVESVFPVPFSVELPSTIDPAVDFPGWSGEDGITPGYASFVYKRGADSTPAYVTLYIPAGVFRDPCHPEEGMLTTSTEPGVDELVDALTSQVGVRAGPVTDITFGGYTGKVFDLDNNIAESACSDAPWLPQWTYRSQGLDSDVVEKSGGLSNTHQRIAIVEVDGLPVLIEAWDLKAGRDEVAEMYRLFESIRFE
jgi:sugar lactone lactonase YvrE